MPVNLMDLYKDESEDKDSSQPTQQSESTEPILEDQATPVVETQTEPVLEDVSANTTPEPEPIAKPVAVEMTEEEKKEYGMTSIPKKIEVEDLEQKTSDFLQDNDLDNDVPDDLDYSSVFKSKTIVNYTLAISGFALLVVGVFSFLNSQNVNIQSSLDVISQTGKGSLADAGPPGMDLGGLIGALQEGGEDSGSNNNVVDENLAADSGEVVNDIQNEDILVEEDDTTVDNQDNGTTQEDVLLNEENNTDSDQDPFEGINNDDFADLFGPIPGSDSGFFGSSDNANDSGSANSNPNDSDLNQLLTDNDFQLDLLDDDSNVNNNGFLSNTNNTIITAGNIAGDSGPEIYLVLFISLIFAGYLTTRTS